MEKNRAPKYTHIYLRNWFFTKVHKKFYEKKKIFSIENSEKIR